MSHMHGREGKEAELGRGRCQAVIQFHLRPQGTPWGMMEQNGPLEVPQLVFCDPPSLGVRCPRKSGWPWARWLFPE